MRAISIAHSYRASERDAAFDFDSAKRIRAALGQDDLANAKLEAHSIKGGNQFCTGAQVGQFGREKAF